MSVTIKDSLAKIAISKNLIKEYKTSDSDRTVYLEDGTEFQIYLKNPYQTHLGIRIYVNEKSIGNMLVLKPGQSCWLDRFVDEKKKFLFSTYEVENSAEMRYAINKNGRVRIQFYHENEEPVQHNIWVKDYYDNTYTISSIPSNLYNNTTISSKSPLGNQSTSSAFYSNATVANIDCAITASNYLTGSGSNTSASSFSAHTKSLETGRVEKGSRSNQEFESCNIDFNNWSFKTEEILILPNSRKQIRVEETRRRYCSQCGKKVNPKDKFCSNCGAKLN